MLRQLGKLRLVEAGEVLLRRQIQQRLYGALRQNPRTVITTVPQARLQHLQQRALTAASLLAQLPHARPQGHHEGALTKHGIQTRPHLQQQLSQGIAMRERRSIQRRSVQGGSVRVGGIRRFSTMRIRIVFSVFSMFNGGTAQTHRHHIRTQQQHTAQLPIPLTPHKTLIVVQRNTRRPHRKRARQIMLNGVQIRDRVAKKDLLQLIAPPSIQSKNVFLHAIRHRGRTHRRNSSRSSSTPGTISLTAARKKSEHDLLSDRE